MTTPTPFSIRSLGTAIALAAFVVLPLHSSGAEFVGAKGSPLTQGWTRVPLKYDIQKEWDVDVSQRHSYDPNTDTHRLWTLRGDKSHAPPPNRTGPRAELRFWNEYYSGEHLFEADVYIVRYLDATVPKKLRRDGVLSEVMGYSYTYLVENLQGAEATRDYFLSRPDDTADL